MINDEKRLLLYDLNRSDNLDLLYNFYPGVDFDDPPMIKRLKPRNVNIFFSLF